LSVNGGLHEVGSGWKAAIIMSLNPA
jgi:hypothetical protein